MKRTTLSALVLLPLAACNAPDAAEEIPTDTTSEVEQADARGDPASPDDATPDPAGPPAQATATTPGIYADVDDPKRLLPSPLSDEFANGETGARNVLLSFVRALEEKEFQVAWAVMTPDLRAQISEADLRAMFDGFGRITASAPEGRLEGAAGSSYYEVPTTITGSNGQEVSGTIVLRRTNDVPGSTAAQRAWHVYRFDVD